MRSFRHFEKTLSVVVLHERKICVEVIGVEREFWRDARKAENSGGICSVEYSMNLSWPVHVQNAYVLIATRRSVIKVILRGEMQDEKQQISPSK